MKPDKDWLEKKIKESQEGSIRQLALKMSTLQGKKIDRSAVSRGVSGDRELWLEALHELRQLADLLGVPMGELIRRLGCRFTKRDNIK